MLKGMLISEKWISELVRDSDRTMLFPFTDRVF